MSDQRKVQGMILIMGETGSGKSYFINKLLQSGHVQTSYGIESATKSCQVVLAVLNDETSIAVIDTPGFDDTDQIERSDDKIVEEIAKFLSYQFLSGIPLLGIVFLYPIIEIRYKGHSRRYFEIFQKMCGEESFGNISLVTTMWDRVKKDEYGEARDRFQQLRSTCWKEMENSGSGIYCFDASNPDIAQSIIYDLYSKSPIELRIQNEIHRQGLRLDQTEVGRLIVPSIDEDIQRTADEQRSLECQRGLAQQHSSWQEEQRLDEELQKKSEEMETKVRRRGRFRRKIKDTTEPKVDAEKRKFTWKDGLTIFLGVAGITGNILISVLCG